MPGRHSAMAPPVEVIVEILPPGGSVAGKGSRLFHVFSVTLCFLGEI